MGEVEVQNQPTRKEFFDWIRKQLEEAGLKKEEIDVVMKILDKAIKTPYPYPYPKPVKGEEKEGSEEVKKLREELEKLRKENEELRKKLEETAIQAEVKEAEALGAEKEEIEEVLSKAGESFEAKMAALRAFKTALSKRRETIRVANKKGKDEFEARLRKVIAETFGEDSVDEILDILGTSTPNQA